MFIINFCLKMFRASLCPFSGEQRHCYCIWCVVLVLLDVVGSACGALSCRMYFNSIRCLLLTTVSTCFGHHYAHRQENKEPCYCFWCVVLVLLDVVGSGCGALRCRMRAVLASSNKAASHKRYQPHPAEPEQHTKCSNRAFVLLKMGIMMPETC